MKWILPLLFFIATQANAIIGGPEVSLNDPIARSTVLVIGYDNKADEFTSCTASVLAQDLLVTAAHCVFKKDTVAFAVFMGLVYSPDLMSKDKLALIEKIELNPDFAGMLGSDIGKNGRSDIALIKLSEPLPRFYTPVSILELSFKITEKSSATVAGFGTDVSEMLSTELVFPLVLRKLDYRVLGIDSLRKLIRLGGRADKNGVRHGDSGGPAYVFKNNRIKLWGVLSGFPASYEDLRRHKVWIEKTAKALGRPLSLH